MRKIQANIHLKSIYENAKAFKALTGKKLCAVVKADAYGHGAEEVACVLDGVADVFAVALLAEAVALRVAACGKDILILTPPISFNEALQAVQSGFILTIASLTDAKMVAKAAAIAKRTARVHLKGNVGMNRYGMAVQELGKTCVFLQGQPLVRVEGLYAHIFDMTKKSAYLAREKFIRLRRVCLRYYENVLCHLSATYGTLLGSDFFFDMTRVGIGLYGYVPDGAKDVDEVLANKLSLRKAMTVYAYAVSSRQYSYGGAGYGKALPNNTPIRYLTAYRVGYADGVLRAKQNGLDGCEKNANNLCMDVCLRTEKKSKGHKIVLMHDAAQAAAGVNSISYEVLCAITKRAERVYDYT